MLIIQEMIRFFYISTLKKKKKKKKQNMTHCTLILIKLIFLLKKIKLDRVSLNYTLLNAYKK